MGSEVSSDESGPGAPFFAFFAKGGRRKCPHNSPITPHYPRTKSSSILRSLVRASFIHKIGAIAAPAPFLRRLHQASPAWIAVYIPELLHARFWSSARITVEGVPSSGSVNRR